MPRLPRTRTYEIRTRFNAPLAFVYRWCTDFRPGDPGLERSSHTRRIIRRSRERVIYEDLMEGAGGWMWSRHVVTLLPPDRWHSDSVGNYRTWSLDYTLRPLSPRSTELHLRGVRASVLLGGRNPPRRELERELRQSWENFGAALERDYRARRRGR